MNIVAEATRVDPGICTGGPVLVGELVPVDLDALQPAPAPTYENVEPLHIFKAQWNTFRRSLARVDWYLMASVAGSCVALGIAGLVAYELYLLVVAVVDAVATAVRWVEVNGPRIIGYGVLTLLALACMGGGAAKCVGLHCGGCRG